MVGAKNVEESMAEFAMGDVAMIQNGNWGWAMIYDLDGNVVKEDDIKFLPIYTGVEGEEKQLYSLERLLYMYEKAVGGNATLLLFHIGMNIKIERC